MPDSSSDGSYSSRSSDSDSESGGEELLLLLPARIRAVEAGAEGKGRAPLTRRGQPTKKWAAFALPIFIAAQSKAAAAGDIFEPSDPQRFIRKWALRFHKEGSVKDKAHPGRPAKLPTSAVAAAAAHIANTNPRTQKEMNKTPALVSATRTASALSTYGPTLSKHSP